MCEKETEKTEEVDELTEMFKNMTPEEWDRLIKELEEAVNSK